MYEYREQVLIEQIREASEAYYTTGKSKLSDREFDALVEELEQINPNAEIFNKREIHGDDWNYQLETLPYKLYSIKKVKTWKDIQNWIDFICKKVGISNNDKGEIRIILTPKYDGIKILHNDSKFFTRYETGEQGYNVTNRIKSSILGKEDLSVEGELIISKSNFKNYCSGYTSSRNFIPAIFSSKEKLATQDKVEYIRYSVYGEEEAQMSKEEQLIYCNKFNNVKVPYLKVAYKDLTEEMIIKFYFDNLSDYEYDGVVVDIDSELIRRELGETQKYLDCCRAYKGDALFDDIKDSQIINITWQMSRYGKLTPVAQILPVMINEGIVTNVSLYNAAYIRDNNIFVGQKVKVTRKGKINPKIVGFIDEGRVEDVALPASCPFCGEPLEWSKNDKNEEVDLICKNDLCKEKLIQKLYFFFKTIGVKDFGLESVKAFVNYGFGYHDFFNEDSVYAARIEGIGFKTKDAFINELNRVRKDIEIEKIQEASGLFQGMSQATLRTLNTLNVDMEFYFNDRYFNEIRRKGLELDGVGEMTLNDYFDGLYNFYVKGFFGNNIKPYFTIKSKEINKKRGEGEEKFLGKNICFTGFRNESWNKIVEDGGGKILSSVTSICNMLVVKDINSTSSKMQKAKQMGIEIMSIEDFQNLIEN
jgi:DNA ligase (NAD+)